MFLQPHGNEMETPASGCGFPPPVLRRQGSRPAPVRTPEQGAPDRAVVVFGDETRLRKLRCLKPGFRHCAVWLRLDQGWIGFEPLSHMWEIRHFPHWNREVDLAAHLRRNGRCALTVPVFEPPRKLAAPLPASCVEAVKRLIGLHSWRIRTPWELFLCLKKINLDD